MGGSDPLSHLDTGHESEAIEQLNKPERLPWLWPAKEAFFPLCATCLLKIPLLFYIMQTIKPPNLQNRKDELL